MQTQMLKDQQLRNREFYIENMNSKLATSDKSVLSGENSAMGRLHVHYC